MGLTLSGSHTILHLYPVLHYPTPHHDVKERVPVTLPRTGITVIWNRKSAVQNMGKLNVKQYCVVNSACLAIIASQFCFETGCYVYHLNVLGAEYFQLQIHCAELNKVN